MSGWSFYVNNGGTVAGVANDDYAVIAADTRCSSGYSIISRNMPKFCELTPTCFIVSSGQRVEIDTLHAEMKAIAEEYTFKHGIQPSVEALSQRLSNQLYNRRFLPYYAFNMLAGINRDGKSVLYSYDSVGNTEPLRYGTVGTGSDLVLPILDALFRDGQVRKVEEIKKLLIDAFTAAAERDIYTGDGLDLVVISRSGKEISRHSLRKD